MKRLDLDLVVKNVLVDCLDSAKGNLSLAQLVTNRLALAAKNPKDFEYMVAKTNQYIIEAELERAKKSDLSSLREIVTRLYHNSSPSITNRFNA